jgi:hypothetical protein
MLQIRRQFLIASLILLTIVPTFSLLLTTTAPNPTGRWFSSAFVDTTQTNYIFGAQAELILANDLKLPQNDSEEGERRCFCSQSQETPPGRCNVCEANSAAISTWVIPDFITNRIIVDSKAVGQFRSSTEQIRSFITIAEQSERELWIFVRKDTTFSDLTLQQIRSTGGDIVPYFVVAGYGYLALIDQAANNIITVALILAVGLLVWEYFASQRRDDVSPSDTLPDEVEHAEDSVEETERYMQRMERLSKKVLKEDDKDD